MKTTYNITHRLWLATLLAGWFCVAVNAQSNHRSVAQKFSDYNSKVLQEKIYLHADRNFYLAGDLLWFKLYVTDAVLHQPLSISKLAYVEVLDASHTQVLQAKIALNKGSGNGSLAIPISLNSGHYLIRAYTNWMKNAGADYFFEKQITIVNTHKNRDTITANASATAPPDIRFFPEGGNLVSGIPSILACRVQGADGKSAAFKALIVDENNDSVAAFQSLKFGMGNVGFTPLPGHRYKALVKVNQLSFTKELPTVYPQGYVMRLSAPANAPITVSVETNLTDTGKVLLLVHTRQSLKLLLNANLVNGKALFTIDPSHLAAGISHFTVFNAADKPVCERLYFSYPDNPLLIKVNSTQTGYTTRSRVDLPLQTLVKENPVADADLSAAVYRLDDLQETDENAIQAYFWLASDLKGRIESPGFYFGANKEAIVPVMNNLMLTQGWRRFKWEDILQEKIPAAVFPPELNGHIITGKVVSTITGKPLDNVETYISVPGLNTNFRTYISDAAGRIKFDFSQMNGSSEIIVQTNPGAIDTASRVELTNPFAETYSETPVSPFYLSSAKQKSLLDQSVNVQVQNLYAGQLLKRFVPSTDTATFILDKPDAIYMMDDYTRFTTIEEVLREYVNLMDVQKKRDKFSLRLWNNTIASRVDISNREFFQTDPLILVDGVPVFDVNRLMGYDPLKMRKLEVYNRRFFSGNSFFSGILNWSSYKGDLANFELDPHALVIDYEGLQLQREFYQPVYDASGASSAAHTPDFRTLLYWSHEIKPDANGERHIRFYTSDKKGRYVTVIQGLAANGTCGSTLHYFEVN